MQSGGVDSAAVYRAAVAFAAMPAAFPRTGNPGFRFGLAMLASLALHAALLAPFNWLGRSAAPRPLPPPLAATLVMPEVTEATATSLATRPEPEPEPPLPRDAALPTPTFSRPLPPPRELKGRALESALAKMTQEEFYPRDAIARGLEGRVVLLLTLDQAGRVVALEMASSSGHALLDDAARHAAGRIASLPGGRRQVLLPVEFRLE